MLQSAGIMLAALSLLVLFATESFAASNCECGFLDPETQQHYTESLIVYFNETERVDLNIFTIEDFSNQIHKGWNSIYRVGASPQNVRFANYNGVQALQLLTQPSTDQHLVSGGSLQSLRKDIQYGSFRAGLKSPGQWTGGTAFTFGLMYNTSESMQVDMLNMKKPEDARLATLINGEWPKEGLVTNYSLVQSDGGTNPWSDFVDLRMDWNKTDVSFNVNNMTLRSILKKDKPLPFAGTSMRLRTWSTGDKTYMQGPPPKNATKSYVLYIKAFFNTTTMAPADHDAYNDRCLGTAVSSSCLTSDHLLRGSSPYPAAALLKWHGPSRSQRIKRVAGFVAAGCSTLGIMILVNLIVRRLRFSLPSLFAMCTKACKKSFHKKSSKDVRLQSSSFDGLAGENNPSSSPPSEGYRTPLPPYASGTQTPVPPYGTQSSRSASPGAEPSRLTARFHDNSRVTTDPFAPRHIDNQADSASEISKKSTSSEEDLPIMTIIAPQPKPLPPTTKTTPIPTPTSNPPPRIDYLAGFVALACIGVTLRHWAQTFWPWIIQGYGNTAHYPKVEQYAKIFLGSYLITQHWIGPFFLTATRFLSANYFRHGNLADIAKKLIRRGPRLFAPIVITFMLQYFLLAMGLGGPLQELPSVGWSTWPYVVAPPNFGVFLNDLVELAYLIPNKAPEVVSHYAVGVLWTVPVQLQFTYVVLTGAVLIRGVKTPWKRACFYGCVILTGWYARSWSACHWCGLALSDLENTYRWKSYLESQKLVKYTIMTIAFIAAAGSPLANVFTSRWSFEVAEHSIHPDANTGKPIMFTDHGPEYPEYFEPGLTILLFSIGLQILVELSTWVQAFLSIKIILWLHPHIMMIYLVHGFVFWTWGAWVTVIIHKAGAPYWVSMIVNLITSYTVLFALVSVLTPLLETPTQAVMRALDRWMMDEPVKKVPTTMPFSKDMVLNQQ